MKKLLLILLCLPLLFGSCSNNSQDKNKFIEFLKEVNKLNNDGTLDYKSQNISKAIKKFTKAIEINESYNSNYPYGNISLLAESYFLRGCVKSRYGEDVIGNSTQNEYRDAIKDFSKAIQLGGLEETQSFADLNQKSAYIQRGYAKFCIDDFDGAILDFTKSIELKPTAGAYMQRGTAKSKLGKLEEGCSDIRQALLINDDDLTKESRQICKEIIERFCK
tara:strand:- start:869 stop:1528 length:660 start_codon:yes stop_codon:yes gene_type:complete